MAIKTFAIVGPMFRQASSIFLAPHSMFLVDLQSQLNQDPPDVFRTVPQVIKRIGKQYSGETPCGQRYRARYREENNDEEYNTLFPSWDL